MHSLLPSTCHAEPRKTGKTTYTFACTIKRLISSAPFPKDSEQTGLPCPIPRSLWADRTLASFTPKVDWRYCSRYCKLTSLAIWKTEGRVSLSMTHCHTCTVSLQRWYSCLHHCLVTYTLQAGCQTTTEKLFSYCFFKSLDTKKH